jgi:hypothetical protein
MTAPPGAESALRGIWLTAGVKLHISASRGLTISACFDSCSSSGPPAPGFFSTSPNHIDERNASDILMLATLLNRRHKTKFGMPRLSSMQQRNGDSARLHRYPRTCARLAITKSSSLGCAREAPKDAKLSSCKAILNHFKHSERLQLRVLSTTTLRYPQKQRPFQGLAHSA